MTDRPQHQLLDDDRKILGLNWEDMARIGKGLGFPFEANTYRRALQGGPASERLFKAAADILRIVDYHRRRPWEKPLEVYNLH